MENTGVETRQMADLQIVPASKSVAPQHVEMMVPLYSYGCAKKIKKALSHLRGIHSVDVDYALQKVTVWGICNRHDVLDTLRKKRREARFWEERAETEVAEDDPIEKAGDVVVKPSPAKIANYKFFKFTKSWKKKMLPLMLYLN